MARYRRRRGRRRSGLGFKAVAGQVAKGIGYAAILGPTLGAGAALFTGAGLITAGSAFMASQVSSTINGLLGGVLGGSSGGNGW